MSQTFYTAEEIYCANEALCVDVRETLAKRKGTDRIKNMLLLLQNFDEEQVSIPKFVCCDIIKCFLQLDLKLLLNIL